MKTENALPPQTEPIARLTHNRSEYYGRDSQKLFGDLMEESAKIVSPIMTNLGELLEVVFLVKGHRPGSPSQKCVDRTMGFIFSRTWDGEANLERHSGDERLLDMFVEFLNRPQLNNKTWRELWSDETFLADTPLASATRQLLGYAYHGLGPRNYNGLFDETIKYEEYIRKLIGATKSAVATVGFGSSGTQSLSTVLLAAEGRLALDQGVNVTTEQLAALARIGIKSMRNALAPSSGSGLKTRDGAIVSESALNWLHARGNYKTTVWLEEELLTAPVPEPIAGEVLFVPFASDDIEFDPVKCRRDGKYTVGPKGAEQTFIDYRAALDCLARMQPASYWKHPNKANNWGTVTAVGFRPRSAEELGLQPAEGGEK